MSLSTDLMGLGMPPLLAQRLATGGTGPLTGTPVGTTYSSSTKIGTSQFLVVATSFASGLAFGLPAIGGDTGAYLADEFIISNQGTSSLLVITSTSVLISMSASLSSIQRIQANTTCVFYPVLGTYTAGLANWIGLPGT